ncbi:unnamed protein product [Rotaria sp. Silwood1]|nr:unnamed protein product [Rotaria sp. Silwood1]
MSVLLLILLITTSSSFALQCRTNCSVGPLSFYQPFQIPDGQCQQRESGSSCSVKIQFNYGTRSYQVTFDTLPISSDYFYISSGKYLSYDINYQCSKGTDCVIPYINDRVYEMSNRVYNPEIIYGEMAPIIENPSRNGTIQCYKYRNALATCGSKEQCSVQYDLQEKTFTSRGCESFNQPYVTFYDSKDHTSLKISCNRDLCNSDEIVSKVKVILINYSLIDENGRKIAKGNITMISSLLMLAGLIFSIFNPL